MAISPAYNEDADIHQMDSTVTPPEDFRDEDAQDIIHPDDNSATKPDEEEDAEKDEKDESGEATPAPDEADALDPELEALGFPALDPELAKDEAVAKRYYETQRGVAKVLEQAKAGKEEVQQHLETLTPYVKYAQAFEDPNLKVAAFEALGKELGITGIAAPAQAVATEFGETDDYKSDLQSVYNKAKADAKAEALSEFEAKYGPDLTALRATREEQVKQKEFEAKVEKESKSVIGFLARTENGWGVTKEMVAQAMREMPDVDPAVAVKRCFPDEYAAHKVAKATGAVTKKGPEMPSGSGSASRGKAMSDKHPLEASIHEIWDAHQS